MLSIRNALKLILNHCKTNNSTSVGDLKNIELICNQLQIYVAKKTNEFDTKTNNNKNQTSSNIFIVDFEGIDGVGKSTCCKRVYGMLLKNKHFKPYLFTTPFGEMRESRAYFDDKNIELRRSFYQTCNVHLSQHIESLNENLLSTDDSKQKIVLIDRFWPSTFAYAMAENPNNVDITSNSTKDLHQRCSQGAEDDLNKINVLENVVCWPCYLVEPDICLLFQLDEEERLRRINKRCLTVEKSKEEDKLQKEIEFKKRIEQFYMKIPNISTIDANETEETLSLNVYHKIIELCDKKSILYKNKNKKKKKNPEDCHN